MITIPTRRFSDVMFVLGIIFTIISGLWCVTVLFNSTMYRGDDPNLGYAFLFLLVSVFVMGVGNKKVVDPDYLIIFLRDFIKKD